MSDEPIKLSPGAPHLDDIILSEDERDDGKTAPSPPVQLKEHEKESAERASTRAKASEPKRPKMTLRIPDDEVSRPQLPATTPMGGVPAASDGASQLQPNRIISIGGPGFKGSADDTLELPPKGKKAPGIDTTNEKGWTPYQPSVADRAAAGSASSSSARQKIPSTPPISEDIPVDMDEPGHPSDEIATSPRLPDANDSGEIKVEEMSDRVIEAAEVSEIEVEDVVSVESIPPPKNSLNPGSGAGVAIPPNASVGGVSQLASHDAAGSGPDLTASPAYSAATQASAIAAAQARRHAAAPFGIMPQVGALAPPPMSEAAANARGKKAKPWWEDLFNDDFIRTMAKITDAEIARETNFIEESLGCEAGATILDLACGTGRHAVELAARGYQVVGFDLSLAMLARASDEAQDRDQKINFVQGDMRDMTFEETFDGIFSWNTSFGYFDDEKNAAVIAKVHRALKKGGQFLLDVVNRDCVIRQAPSLAWFEGDGCICMDEMQIDFITSRMKVKRTLMMDDGRTKEIEYSIRIYSLHELGKMLHDNGFRVAEASGRTGTPGVFFGCESPRTLILAEKR